MKVFDLTCDVGHRFEGWFASAERFAEQTEAAAVRCPICDSSVVQRAPSAPRLNLHGGPNETLRDAATIQHRMETPEPAMAAVFERLRRVIASTENVGPRFAEEARRIHYEETPARPIRGTATERERRELDEEGIETLSFPLPPALAETLQ
jgi:hypothetical protein